MTPSVSMTDNAAPSTWHAANREKVDAGLKLLTRYCLGWDKYRAQRKGDQWHFTNRFSTKTICVPAIFDIGKKFVGATDKDSDGCDQKRMQSFQGQIRGDRSEQRLLDAFADLEGLGGILFGGMKFSDIAQGENTDQNQAQVPTKMCESEAETDFIFVHPFAGVFIIEVKSSPDSVPKACKQIKKWRIILTDLLKEITKDSNINIKIGGIVYISKSLNELMNCASKKRQKKNRHNVALAENDDIHLLTNDIVEDNAKIRDYFADKLHFDNGAFPTNLFKNEIYRVFVAYLVGCRPSFYMSPVGCAMQLLDPLQAQFFVTNWKKKENRKGELKENQNRGFTFKQVVECFDAWQTHNFKTKLEQLNMFANRSPEKNENLELQKLQEITFTPDQKETICDQSPLLLVHGPPGCGKTLILMMRLLFAAADECRTHIPIIVCSWADHLDTYKELLKGINSKRIIKFHAMRSIDFAKVHDFGKCDVFMDEVLREDWQNIDTRIKDLQIERYSIVLSSMLCDEHELHTIDQTTVSVHPLLTIFRGPENVVQFWHAFYTGDTNTSAQIGHRLRGSRVMTRERRTLHWFVDDLLETIIRLFHVEKCDPSKVAIIFESDFEMEEVQFLLCRKLYAIYRKVILGHKIGKAERFSDLAAEIKKDLDEKRFSSSSEQQRDHGRLSRFERVLLAEEKARDSQSQLNEQQQLAWITQHALHVLTETSFADAISPFVNAFLSDENRLKQLRNMFLIKLLRVVEKPSVKLLAFVVQFYIKRRFPEQPGKLPKFDQGLLDAYRQYFPFMASSLPWILERLRNRLHRARIGLIEAIQTIVFLLAKNLDWPSIKDDGSINKETALILDTLAVEWMEKMNESMLLQVYMDRNMSPTQRRQLFQDYLSEIKPKMANFTKANPSWDECRYALKNQGFLPQMCSQTGIASREFPIVIACRLATRDGEMPTKNKATRRFMSLACSRTLAHLIVMEWKMQMPLRKPFERRIVKRIATLYEDRIDNVRLLFDDQETVFRKTVNKECIQRYCEIAKNMFE